MLHEFRDLRYYCFSPFFLRYYPEVHGLENTIICDLQLLFDCITTLISAICIQKHLSKEEETLRITGHCTGKLLHRLLHRLLCQNYEQNLTVDTAITFFRHLRLVADTGKTQDEPEYSDSHTAHSTDCTVYFVPCVLRMFPIEMILATAKAYPSPLLITFDHGYSPLGLFSQLFVHLASVEVEGWDLKENALFRNIAVFYVGEDMDEITIIARTAFYEVIFVGDNADHERTLPISDACNMIYKTINAAITRVKLALNSTLNTGHSIAFYCTLPQCKPRDLHLAIQCGRKLKCLLSRRPFRLTSSQKVWFGEVTQCIFLFTAVHL